MRMKKRGTKIKIPKLLPSAKKIATRGLYEIISPNTKQIDYEKRINRV